MSTKESIIANLLCIWLHTPVRIEIPDFAIVFIFVITKNAFNPEVINYEFHYYHAQLFAHTESGNCILTNSLLLKSLFKIKNI